MVIPHPGGEDSRFPLIFIGVCISLALLVPALPLPAGEESPGIHEPPPPAPLVLTLEKAVDLAIQNNRNIASSQFRAESQQYSVVAAKSDFDLKFVPGANTSFSDSRLIGGRNIGAGIAVRKKLDAGTVVSLSPTVTWLDREYWNDVTLSVEQPLFRGFGEDVNLDNVRSAEFSKATAIRNIYQTKVNIGLETITTYYNALKQREIYELSQAMATRLRGHSAVAMAKEKVGLATPIETYRAEIQLKEAEGSATQASEAYQDALDRIKVILSLPLKTEITLVAPAEPDYVPADLSGAVQTALQNRIEIEQAKAEIQEAERKSQVMEKNTLPGISLVMSVSQYDVADTFSQAASLRQNSWNVALQGSTDLQQTAEKAAYRQSLLTVRMLRLELDNRMEEIRKQVRKQWTAFQEDAKRIRIRKEQMQQAREKLALAEVKYAHGMTDNFDVIEAETELQRARVMLLASETDYQAGTYNMKAILGMLLPRK